MAVRDIHWKVALATGAACAALAACSPPAPQESAPPPPPAPEAPPPPLAGGPPPAPPPTTTVVTMAPIPNPGDLSPADRRRIYGPGHHGRRIERVYGAAPVHASHPAPVVHAAAPAPVVAHAAPPPPAPVAAPVGAPPSKLVQLQTAVGQTVAQGSNLAVSPDIAQGKPGGVSLSLPANLLDVLRDQAAKFGFKRAARKADVSATLSGDGYAVTPNGAQTQALKSGQAAQFAWQVTPGQNANGPLRAQVSASLKGQGEPKLLSLATLQSAVVQVQAQAQQAAAGLHLPPLPNLSDIFAKLFGHKADAPAQPAAPAAATPAPAADAGLQSPLHDRTLPIVGHVTVRAQIAAFLAFLAVLILLLIQRNMSEQRRAAERRRFRTMSAAYQPTDLDEPVASSHHAEPAHHDEPAAHAEDSHDDGHGHGHEAAHDDGHGHDAHGHDDGHGHDDHGHGDSHDHAHKHEDEHEPA